MGRINHITLLAGSAEAGIIAQGLRAQGIAVRVVLSELQRGANPLSPPYLLIRDVASPDFTRAIEGADAVIDASHGFDGLMTQNGAALAAARGLPFISLQRPPWDLAEDPLWRSAASVAHAMALIRPNARVFSATGWDSLPEYATFRGRSLMLRQTTPHHKPVPFDFVELVFDAPPFTKASETALFQERGVDLLICRNLGGEPSRPKLEAAKALGLEVILIDRPALPDDLEVVSTVEEVLAWAAAQQ